LIVSVSTVVRHVTQLELSFSNATYYCWPITPSCTA